MHTITVGPLTITATLDENGHLTAVTLPEKVPAGLHSAHLAEALRQLGKYTLAFPKSGPFVLKVWDRLRTIPWGQALTYGELATQLGNPRGSRAVGQACGKNRLLLIVPCRLGDDDRHIFLRAPVLVVLPPCIVRRGRRPVARLDHPEGEAAADRKKTLPFPKMSHPPANLARHSGTDGVEAVHAIETESVHMLDHAARIDGASRPE